ncbi:hypothetical protein LTR78_000254 [Recurvomyces mirabilis]|uniref:Uncharacterized protein n=1 Tax=Recurvomyces mirabilis TaxID=574656 RepID=A0AAE1C6D8_9PEZI|nr:hypothetical protein LTR78_000254 [Recurvomyces mirabilis]KAK5161910.1 hypothetical protein LTS14_000255 [Recurvomyces mirabilis]
MLTTYAVVALFATVAVTAPVAVDSDPGVFINTLHHHGGVVRNGDPVQALADEASPTHYTMDEKPYTPFHIPEPVEPVTIGAPEAPVKPQAMATPEPISVARHTTSGQAHQKRWCLWPVGTFCSGRAWLDGKKTDMWGDPVRLDKEKPGHSTRDRSAENREHLEKRLCCWYNQDGGCHQKC